MHIHYDHLIVLAISMMMVAFHLDFEMNVTHDAILHVVATVRHGWTLVQQAAFVDVSAI